MDKRADPWGDFLRRLLLLSASLAGTALPVAAAEDTATPQEVTDPDPPPQPAALEPARN